MNNRQNWWCQQQQRWNMKYNIWYMCLNETDWNKLTSATTQLWKISSEEIQDNIDPICRDTGTIWTKPYRSMQICLWEKIEKNVQTRNCKKTGHSTWRHFEIFITFSNNVILFSLQSGLAGSEIWMKFLAHINRPLTNYLPIIDIYLGKGKASMTYQWNVLTFLDQDIR